MWLLNRKTFVLSLISLLTYCFDVGADSWVGHILMQECHTRFGSTVYCFIFITPGVFVFLESNMLITIRKVLIYSSACVIVFDFL